MFQENRAKRSPMQIIGLIVIFILAVLIILTFVIFGMFKDEGSAPKLFGYRVFVVDNDRMEPRIPEGAAVFVEEGTLPDPTKQSVILCRIDDQLWVIGFVGTQTTESGEVSYLVKYDNATDDKTWGIKQTDIIGVAKTQDKLIGGIIRFASSKVGMMTIVIIPCLIVIIYEVIMLLVGGRGYVKEGSSSRKSKKRKDRSSGEEVIRRVGGGPDDEDAPPEREDIQIPIDPVKEEKFVEKQLRKANDKLHDTVKEETGVLGGEDEIRLDKLEVEPETVIRRSDILREGAQTMEPLKDEAEKIAQNLRTASDPGMFAEEPKPAPTPVHVPEPKPEPKPEPTPEPKSEKTSVIGELSAARIDELIKLLEEEKKRLGDGEK